MNLIQNIVPADRSRKMESIVLHVSRLDKQVRVSVKATPKYVSECSREHVCKYVKDGKLFWNTCATIRGTEAGFVSQ